jgi:hypothetical protein
MVEGARDRPARAGGERRTRLDRQHLGGADGPQFRQGQMDPACVVTDVRIKLDTGMFLPTPDGVRRH